MAPLSDISAQDRNSRRFGICRTIDDRKVPSYILRIRLSCPMAGSVTDTPHGMKKTKAGNLKNVREKMFTESGSGAAEGMHWVKTAGDISTLKRHCCYEKSNDLFLGKGNLAQARCQHSLAKTRKPVPVFLASTLGSGCRARYQKGFGS